MDYQFVAKLNRECAIFMLVRKRTVRDVIKAFFFIKHCNR